MISNRLDSHVEWKFCCAVFHDFFCGKQWWFLNPGCWKLSNLISVSFFILIQQKKTSNFLPLSHKRIMELYWFSSSSHFHFSQFEKLTIWMKQNWNSSALLFPQKKIHEINNLKGLFLEEKIQATSVDVKQNLYSRKFQSSLSMLSRDSWK